MEQLCQLRTTDPNFNTLTSSYHFLCSLPGYVLDLPTCIHKVRL